MAANDPPPQHPPPQHPPQQLVGWNRLRSRPPEKSPLPPQHPPQQLFVAYEEEPQQPVQL
jgi:hypothetical protein